jgi:hypothetical protein
MSVTRTGGRRNVNGGGDAVKNALIKVLKIVHWLVWFPLSAFFGPDFPQRLFRRKAP